MILFIATTFFHVPCFDLLGLEGFLTIVTCKFAFTMSSFHVIIQAILPIK